MPEKSAFTLLLEAIADNNRLPAYKADQLLRIIRRKIRRLKIHNIINKFLKM